MTDLPRRAQELAVDQALFGADPDRDAELSALVPDADDLAAEREALERVAATLELAFTEPAAPPVPGDLMARLAADATRTLGGPT